MNPEKPVDIQMAEQLESSIDVNISPIDDLLKLAQLYLERIHEDKLAELLLEKIVEREPGHAWGTYWLAYYNYHHRFEWVLAKRLLEDWLSEHPCNSDNREVCAAIYELLVETRDDWMFNDISDSERIALLEESVRLAPDWTSNRLYLGRAYLKVGRSKDAILQLEAAKANQVTHDQNWDPFTEIFEIRITGRWSSFLTELILQLLMIEDLRSHIDVDSSPIDEILKLIQLYMQQLGHRWNDAAPLIEKVFQREPGNAWATYWLAYHYSLVRGGLLSAKHVLEDWLSAHACNDCNAEACSEIYRFLVKIRDDPECGNLSDRERIALLEKSVRLAPHWAWNRWSLAQAYLKVGRSGDALVQLKTAKANQIDSDPKWDVLTSYFEVHTTGRANRFVQEHIAEMMDELLHPAAGQ